MASQHVDPEVISRRDLLRWGTVRAGLAINFGGTLLMFLGLAVIGVILFLNEGQLKKGIPVLSLLVLILSGYAILAGTVMVILGGCMTSSAPSGTGAKGWGLMTMVFSLLCMVLVILSIIAFTDSLGRQQRLQQAENPLAQQVTVAPFLGTAFSPQEVQLMFHGMQGTYLLALVSFFFCQRAIAKRFGREGLAVGIIFYTLVYVAVSVGLNFLGQILPPPETPKDMYKLVAFIVGGLLFLEVWGLIVLAMSRGALTEGLLTAKVENA